MGESNLKVADLFVLRFENPSNCLPVSESSLVVTMCAMMAQRDLNWLKFGNAKFKCRWRFDKKGENKQCSTVP